ncbi:MAG TPA: hypothetical protein VHA37_07400 [Candidatus Saccharimonadales bacterium]|nr:hypothetical protein [Candidatus Saccharimonadales bacterium]
MMQRGEYKITRQGAIAFVCGLAALVAMLCVGTYLFGPLSLLALVPVTITLGSLIREYFRPQNYTGGKYPFDKEPIRVTRSNGQRTPQAAPQKQQLDFDEVKTWPRPKPKLARATQRYDALRASGSMRGRFIAFYAVVFLCAVGLLIWLIVVLIQAGPEGLNNVKSKIGVLGGFLTFITSLVVSATGLVLAVKKLGRALLAQPASPASSSDTLAERGHSGAASRREN